MTSFGRRGRLALVTGVYFISVGACGHICCLYILCHLYFLVA